MTPVVDAVLPHPAAAPRILVVDDARDMREMQSQLLIAFGMDVFTAQNGQTALMAARQLVPNVVVTDIDMPVMNGLDLCRHLHADVATRHIPIVVLTGTDCAAAALEAGCDVVLEKPCSVTMLLDTIQQLLNRSLVLNRMSKVTEFRLK